MTKSDIVNEISRTTGIEKVAVQATVEAFMESIKNSVVEGKNVYLRGFGSFVVKKRAEKIWTLLVCILLFANGMVSCDSSDLDKLPQNENPEVAFVNDEVPQRLSLNNARLKRVVPSSFDSVYSGKVYEYS